MENNFSGPTVQEEVKGTPGKAILLGLLTFLLTPAVALIVAVPFLIFGSPPESYNPLVIIAFVFKLEGLGGYFITQLIFLALLVFLGNGITALLTWYVYRSKKLALITFVAAFIFQSISNGIIMVTALRQSSTTSPATIHREQAQQYAQVGDVKVAVRDAYSDNEIDNTHPEFGSIYKSLQFSVPVQVARPATYLVHAKYEFSKGGVFGQTQGKEVRVMLPAGSHNVQLTFFAHEVSSYGFWAPTAVDGTVEIQLFYLSSERELLDSIEPKTKLEQRAYEQFLIDEGLDQREAITEVTIPKFIEKKVVQF